MRADEAGVLKRLRDSHFRNNINAEDECIKKSLDGFKFNQMVNILIIYLIAIPFSLLILVIERYLVKRKARKEPPNNTPIEHQQQEHIGIIVRRSDYQRISSALNAARQMGIAKCLTMSCSSSQDASSKDIISVTRERSNSNSAQRSIRSGRIGSSEEGEMSDSNRSLRKASAHSASRDENLDIDGFNEQYLP